MIDSTNIRLYVFVILQYKRFCLYLLNKNYRRKLNRLRMSVEDWRVNMYKWESYCFIDFRFSVSSRVKRKLEIDWIEECWRVVREEFQESCVDKVEEDERVSESCVDRVEEGERVSESDFDEVKEDERVSEDDVDEIEECERIVCKEFQDERIVHVHFFVVVLVIRNFFFVLRLDLLISKSCSCSVLITSMSKDSKGTYWKSLTVNNTLCSVFLCSFSALISTTLRQKKSSSTIRSNVRCVW